MADLKFIVSEVNKLINTDYNMISFDALPVANLVQILVDVLHDFGALSQVNYFSIDEFNCFFFFFLCFVNAEKNNLRLELVRDDHLWEGGMSEWCRCGWRRQRRCC